MINKFLRNAVLLLGICGFVYAGEFHGGSDVICSDCHTTHFSQRGTLPEGAEPGGPYPDLLLIDSADRLCLACHDGTDPAAPDVLAPVIMYDGSGSEYSGAGFFSGGEGMMSGTGHDLGIARQAPYSNPARAMMLSCISCHDPHGTESYRNLVLDPDSSGTGLTVSLGSDVFENVHPANPPNRSGSIAAYRAGNTGYRDNINAWCAECHNGLLQLDQSNPPAHFQRHPISASFEVMGYHVSPSHWMTGAGEGFGMSTGDGVEGVPRLRFQAPNATDYISATSPALTNQVFCYSCHFAHGGPNRSGVTWPYDEQQSGDQLSGCQQCHFK
jgi:hypothetical protein